MHTGAAATGKALATASRFISRYGAGGKGKGSGGAGAGAEGSEDAAEAGQLVELAFLAPPK